VYNTLKKEEPNRIAVYKDLLSRVLTKGKLLLVLDRFLTTD